MQLYFTLTCWKRKKKRKKITLLLQLLAVKGQFSFQQLLLAFSPVLKPLHTLNCNLRSTARNETQRHTTRHVWAARHPRLHLCPAPLPAARGKQLARGIHLRLWHEQFNSWNFVAKKGSIDKSFSNFICRCRTPFFFFLILWHVFLMCNRAAKASLFFFLFMYED